MCGSWLRAASCADMLPAMMADEEAEVRRVVASRIDSDVLCHMAADKDAEVRLAVVRRLTPAELIGFHRDPDWRVRYEAARRIPPGALSEMLDDPDDMVRDFVRWRRIAARERGAGRQCRALRQALQSSTLGEALRWQISAATATWSS